MQIRMLFNSAKWFEQQYVAGDSHVYVRIYVLMCIAGLCESVNWGWDWLNEQLLAPAVTTTISLVSFILLCAFSALFSVAPTFTVITVLWWFRGMETGMEADNVQTRV